MEGTRIQAKFSVAAIAALAGASNQSVFSDLYNVYIHTLFFSLLLRSASSYAHNFFMLY